MRLLAAVLIAGAVIFAVAAQTPPPEYGFLTERVSITNKDGIVAFPSGTRVEILDHHGSKMSVRAEDKTLEVSSYQVTTDAAKGSTLREQDAARQAAVQQQLSATTAAVARVSEPKPAQPRPAAAPPDPHAPANDRLAQIHKERDQLKMDLTQVNFEQKGLPKPNSVKKSHGKVISFQSSPKAEELAIRRKELEKKIFDLEQEEKRLKLESK